MFLVITYNYSNSPVDFSKLENACNKLQVDYFFSDSRFCPILSVRKEIIDNKEKVIVETINEGLFNSLKTRTEEVSLKEVDNLKDFILEVYKLRWGNVPTQAQKPNNQENALF